MRENMNKKEFFASVFLCCLASFLIQIWFIGNHADSLAKVTNYLFALGIFPFVIAITSPAVLLFATSKVLTSKQKFKLFLYPVLFTGLLFVYMLFMLNSEGF
jgi:hypothetical protein